MTRSRVGTQSSISLTVSPIACKVPPQHGQVFTSTVTNRAQNGYRDDVVQQQVAPPEFRAIPPEMLDPQQIGAAGGRILLPLGLEGGIADLPADLGLQDVQRLSRADRVMPAWRLE